jgi:ribosomal protein S6--L-glutamate ligase
MKKKKMLVVVETLEMDSYRTDRVSEEAEKLGVETVIACSKEMKIFSDKVLAEDGEEIDFSEYASVFSIGNSSYHHYVIAVASSKTKVKCWPNAESFNMSDKFFEGIFFSSIGVPVPKTLILNSKKRDDIISKSVELVGGYPCVIKKVTGSEGRYVGLVNSRKELDDFIEGLPNKSISGKKGVLLQEYIAESKGTDFRVYCVGKEVLGAIKRTSSGEDFRANVSLGGKAEKAEVPKEMEKFAKKIMKKGGFLFAGIDFIKSNGGYLVVEVNTSADFKGFETATGINVAEKILKEII